MSSINIAGDTSGSVILTVPAAAGSNTVTIAAQTGTLNAAGPAFSAYQSTLQSIANNTPVKIQFQTEDFDTANCFDNTTNYRFTPNVAGYYQVNSAVRLDGASGTSEIYIAIYKNGSIYRRGWNMSGVQIATNFWQMSVSTLLYLNGTSDYIESYAFHNSGAAKNTTASSQVTFFEACLLRGA